MRFISALLSVSTFLFGLSIDIQSGKDKGSLFSTIHIKHESSFICEENINEFDVVLDIQCYFNKAPVKTFHPLKNQFFSVKSYETAKLYVIKFKPMAKIKLYDIKDNIATKKRFVHRNQRLAKHWMVIGYEQSLPLISFAPVPKNGINFPIDFSKETLPYVGALGLDDYPIELNQVKDVRAYVNIRKLYTREQYEQVLERVDETLTKEPDTIFKSEFMLYKIRSLMKMDQQSEAVDMSKEFLRLYSGDESVAEVLLLLAKALSQIGFIIDAEYFFDRLLNEHYETKHATLGLIELGSHILAKGDHKKALKYFQRALEKAKDKEIASEAAIKLANYYIARGKSKEAAFYMQKIADSNIKFLLDDFEKTYDVAVDFADHESYKEAADLMLRVLDELEKTDKAYEDILRLIGNWYDKAKLNEKAYKYYKRYIKEFEYGAYLPEIEENMDKVMFKMQEGNTTTKLELFDTIREKYKKEEIANKALYKKAKLLYDEKAYQKIIDMKESLYALDPAVYAGMTKMVNNSARIMAERSLNKKDCQRALYLIGRYDFNLTKAYSESLYGCTMHERDYKYSSKIAEPFIKDKDLTERMKWLYRYVKTSFKAEDYKTVFVTGQDLLTLGEVENNTTYNDIMVEIFWSSLKLKEDETAIKYITKIEKDFGLRFSDIELYVAMSRFAKAKHDYTMIENYTTKVMKLQKQNKSYTQSPMIEYMHLNAIKKLSKYEKAYAVAKELSTRVKKAKDIARIFYEVGSLAQRLGKAKEAKKAFEKSSKADKDSPWSKLSRDALAL